MYSEIGESSLIIDKMSFENDELLLLLFDDARLLLTANELERGLNLGINLLLSVFIQGSEIAQLRDRNSLWGGIITGSVDIQQETLLQFTCDMTAFEALK